MRHSRIASQGKHMASTPIPTARMHVHNTRLRICQSSWDARTAPKQHAHPDVLEPRIFARVIVAGRKRTLFFDCCALQSTSPLLEKHAISFDIGCAA